MPGYVQDYLKTQYTPEDFGPEMRALQEEMYQNGYSREHADKWIRSTVEQIPEITTAQLTELHRTEKWDGDEAYLAEKRWLLEEGRIRTDRGGFYEPQPLTLADRLDYLHDSILESGYTTTEANQWIRDTRLANPGITPEQLQDAFSTAHDQRMAEAHAFEQKIMHQGFSQ